MTDDADLAQRLLTAYRNLAEAERDMEAAVQRRNDAQRHLNSIQADINRAARGPR